MSRFPDTRRPSDRLNRSTEYDGAAPKSSHRLTGVGDLVEAGIVPARRQPALAAVAARYAIAITPSQAESLPVSAAMRRQFIPDTPERLSRGDERADPIGDGAHSPVPGIVHRYPDRVLLMPTSLCATYCRYCFRREMVGGKEAMLNQPALARALDYIRANAGIWEVILSGGDPLILSPRRLRAIREALDGIDHVKVIRIHSRVPVSDPARVTDALIAALSGPKPVWIAVHVNHADELNAGAGAALAMLAQAGFPLVSQSVLLAGVNDDPGVLEALFRRLVELRVKPYYLHHLDPAPGTAHFRVDPARGQDIVEALRGPVSGLCQPNYMVDLPGGAGKVPLTRDRLQQGQVRSLAGEWLPVSTITPDDAG